MPRMGSFRKWLRYGSLAAFLALVVAGVWGVVFSDPWAVLTLLSRLVGNYGMVAMLFGIGGLFVGVWSDAALERFDKRRLIDLAHDMKTFATKVLEHDANISAQTMVLYTEQARDIDRRMTKLGLGQVHASNAMRDLPILVPLIHLAKAYLRVSGPLLEGNQKEARAIIVTHNATMETWKVPNGKQP